jgi:hypothetical protein
MLIAVSIAKSIGEILVLVLARNFDGVWSKPS